MIQLPFDPPPTFMATRLRAFVSIVSFKFSVTLAWAMGALWTIADSRDGITQVLYYVLIGELGLLQLAFLGLVVFVFQLTKEKEQ